jgi:hypothetical protein
MLCTDVVIKQKCLFLGTENRKVKQVLLWIGTSGSGEYIRKMCRRVNVLEICTHV